MTTALGFLALCLLWGLPIVVSFCLCHAAKREPVEFGGDQKAGLTPSKSINPHTRCGLRGADHKFGVGGAGMVPTVQPTENQLRPTHALTLSSGLVAQLEDAGHSRLTATDCAGRNASHDPSISGSMYEGSNPSEARHLTLSSPQEL